ncbi:UNVERIFIED_CONTAM: hypothetical protein K2H54_059414 [Gekko kuhli]
MCTIQKTLTAHSVEWKDCLRCIVHILDWLNTAEALEEKQCLLKDVQERKDACDITLADLRKRVVKQEGGIFTWSKMGMVAKMLPAKSTILRSPTDPAGLKSLTNPNALWPLTNPAIQRSPTGPAASHKSQHIEASHKSCHSIARSRSSCGHKTDATKLVKAKIDAMLAAKRAEFAKREETLRREAGRLKAEKEDREVKIKSLHKELKAEEMAARAKFLQDGYWDPELNFNPVELGVLDPSQRVLNYVQEQNMSA